MKNLVLEKIIADMDACKFTHGLVIQKLQKELKEVVELALVPHQAKINAAIELVQNSNDLTYIDDEYAYQYARVDFSDILEDIGEEQLELFKDHLKWSIVLFFDEENSCLMSCIGPAIVVNDDGSVYDQESNKVILRKSEYSDEVELRALIEAYMEKSGYFPWVLRQYSQGNSVFVFERE